MADTARGRKRFRRLAAMTSMLVAASSGSSAAPYREPPRNARECGLIIADIVEEQMANSSPDMLVEFLKSTNVDKILEKLCAEGRYDEAYRLGQGFLGGKSEARRGPAPLTPECIKDEEVGAWKVTADAGRYVLTRWAEVTSFDPERVEAQTSAQFLMVRSISDGTSQYWLSPHFVAPFAPQSFDVVLRTSSGEERHGTVPLLNEKTIVLTTLIGDIKETDEVKVTASFAGKPLFSATFGYRGFSRPQYQGMVLAYRLKEMRERGACHDRPCFLTTACCELIGLPDDCFELRTLRRFRDRVLAVAPQGAGEIAFYYEAAPLILEGMKAAGDERRLLGYYATHILPCALMARAGLVRPTYWLYRDLMRRLCRSYGRGLSLPAV